MLEKINMQIFAYPFVFYWFLGFKKIEKKSTKCLKIGIQSFSFS